MFRGIKIGRIAGIPFLINPTWFLIFALVSFSIATQELPYLILGEQEWVYWVAGVAVALCFFSSLLAHELGHSIASRHYDIPVISITLYMFGGVAQIGREVKRAREEFVIAIAGPAVSLVIGVVFWGGGYLVSPMVPIIGGSAQLLGVLNLAILVFNLVPGFPLDGGRVLRAIIWGITGNYLRATRVASISGQIIGALMIAFGLFMGFTGRDPSAIWIAFVGFFLITMARQSQDQAVLQESLKSGTVLDIMTSLIRVPATLSVDELYMGYIRTTGWPAYLVEMYDRPSGIVWQATIQQIPHEQWPGTPLATIMQPIELIPAISPTATTEDALYKMNDMHADVLKVMENEQPVGVVTRANIVRSAFGKQGKR